MAKAARQAVWAQPDDRPVLRGVFERKRQQRPIELHGNRFGREQHEADARVLADVIDGGRDDTATRAPSAHARRRLCVAGIEGAARVSAPLAEHHHVVVQEHAARELHHEMLAVRAHPPHAGAVEAARDHGLNAGARAELDAFEGASLERLLEPFRGPANFGSLAHLQCHWMGLGSRS
jgi:hypothetical protein